MHNDLADLFVNRPGYIFKFKNFSWIDYALHSGAPKKSVIIKLKTGNEVEVAIKIKELFLYSPKENEDLYYSIEFVSNMMQNNQMQNESNLIQSTPSTQIPDSKILENDTNVNTFEEKAEPTEVSFEENFAEEVEKETSVDLNTIEEEKPVLKLKVDDTIFDNNIDSSLKEQNDLDINNDFTADYVQEESPKLKVDITTEDEIFKPIDEITSDYIQDEPPRLKVDITTEDETFRPIEEINSDYIQEEPPRLKINITTEDETFRPIEEINSDYIQEEPPRLKIDITTEEEMFKPIEEINSDYIQEEQAISSMEMFGDINLDSDKDEENVDFDLYKCVDGLGLDISLIGELITDYMDKIDRTIPAFKTSIEEDNEIEIKKNIYELKGISDSLRMQQLSNSLESILKATNNNSKKLELEKFANLVAKFKRELI